MKNLKKAESGQADREAAVRATFSLPGQAIRDIEQLRMLLGRRGVLLNRSELVRLGLAALHRLPERELMQVVDSLQRLKAGRPPLV
jgi:hypothetical protein